MGSNSVYLGDWSAINSICDIKNKQESSMNYLMLMFNRTNQMFEYKGLPDTIPAYMIEKYLQLNGHVCVTKVKGKLYALPGNLGGAPDPYFRPTMYIVANPALEFSASLKVLNFLDPAMKQDTQGECVLIKNDTNAVGLLYIATRYATQLAENDISIRCAQINARQLTLISGNTSTQIASGEKYFADIEAGKWGVVADQSFLDGIKAVNVSTQSSNSILQLIELQQYLKASWFNEIGLNANFNMKREYLSEEEIKASTDILLPLLDDMLRCREEAVSLINSTYGTNITVDKNSAWLAKQEEIETEQAIKEQEANGEEVSNNDGSDA